MAIIRIFLNVASFAQYFYGSLTQRKPTAELIKSGVNELRFVVRIRSAWLLNGQAPPRMTRAKPVSGPVGFEMLLSVYQVSLYQSAVHSHKLPAMPKTPKGLAPLGNASTGFKFS